MARYIDADLIPYTDDDDYLSQYPYRYDIDEIPTADVVPKSDYDAVVEENESLGIELENIRRNLGDAREGWNDAECKVEELKAIIADHMACEEQLEELYSNAKNDVDKLREINNLLTEAGQEWQRRYNNAKADVAREIFDLVELKMFCNRYEHIPFGSSERVKYYDIELEDAIAELKKKYLEGKG